MEDSIEEWDIRKQGPPDTDNLLQTRVSNCLSTQVMICEFTSTFFSLMGLWLGMIMYEVRNSENDEKERPLVIAGAFNLICTLALVVSLYFRYDTWL